MKGSEEMSYFKNLHPICIFVYFVLVIGMILVCMNPVIMLLACIGALLLLVKVKEGKSILGWLKMIFPMLLLIVAANSLFNRQGTTNLLFLFGQWIYFEAICYGITAGLSLAALILWFACYQKLMTSDKFLYLFGRIAPATALLISMTMGLIPKLQIQLWQIKKSEKMRHPNAKHFRNHWKRALCQITALVSWSLENAVELADSMKARGYGIKRRTAFHLFRLESRDVRFLTAILLLGGFCVLGRCMGYGHMEFYPEMDELCSGKNEVLFDMVFLMLMCMPEILVWKEERSWRCCVLKQ